MTDPGAARRPATPAELKAVASPLRLRILQLCRLEPRTNRQLADAIGRNPATILHHVRRLVDTGFLAPQPARPGPRGSREKPYRATGLQRHLDLDAVDDVDTRPAISSTILDAAREKILAAGPDDALLLSGVGARLDAAAVVELTARLQALVEELAEGSAPPPGSPTVPLGLVVGLYRLPESAPDAGPADR